MKDRARIFVQGGRGGDGCLSFRREAHVPKGGPDGGDGGHGGEIVLVCDDSYRDLEHFRRASHFKAKRGGHGQGAARHGADGPTLEIPVPPGTEVLIESDGTAHDLVRPGQRATVARGGSGGRGNRHFAGPTHQTPRFAERGLAGEESWLTLQLKLLADAGLVGLPNAGKSSLIARLTRAAPKIAGYPFTTLSPVLGTLHAGERQLVIADIPGLIEGAAEGAGLGHDFLAHVERTRLLVHVLDLAPLDGSDPVSNYELIEHELAAYDARLAALGRILVLSKADLVSVEVAEAARLEWIARLGPEVPVIVTSAVSRIGLDQLSVELLRRIPLALGEDGDAGESGGVGAGVAGGPAGGLRAGGRSSAGGGPATGLDDLPEYRVFKPTSKREVKVRRNDDGVFVVDGAVAERLIARYDLDNEDALAYLEQRLRSAGVIRALEEAGFKSGDDVEIGGILFDLDP